MPLLARTSARDPHMASMELLRLTLSMVVGFLRVSVPKRTGWKFLMIYPQTSHSGTSTVVTHLPSFREREHRSSPLGGRCGKVTL